jgi:hypothetical protein
VYQTKWLKHGLRPHLPDLFAIPQVATATPRYFDGLSDAYVPGHDADDRANYPYLPGMTFPRPATEPDQRPGLSADGNRRSARRVTKGWRWCRGVREAEARGAATWHAAEVFLYLFEAKRNRMSPMTARLVLGLLIAATARAATFYCDPIHGRPRAMVAVYVRGRPSKASSRPD